jgi:hypothetical protein
MSYSLVDVVSCRSRYGNVLSFVALMWFAGCTPLGGVADPPTDDVDDGTGSTVPFTDPLSMPATPTLAAADFNSAETCAGCHPNHFAQWSTSMHSYATVDPVWRALVLLRQQAFDGERDRFCTQCHSAIGTRSGEFEPNFSFDDISDSTLEGVRCEACHKVQGLARAHNSGHILDPSGQMRGPIADPAPGAAHESEYSALHDTSDFCGGCDDVIEQEGLNLERPFEEWLTSPAGGTERNCQSCHMPTYTGRAAAVEGVPVRDNLHVHRFIGVDMPLSDGFIEDESVREFLREEITTLLRSAGSIELDVTETVRPGAQLDVFVTVRNLIDAHNLPTGSTFNRQLWVALTATDAEGNVLYETGHLDDAGDLRDHFSTLDPYGDSDLIRFGSGFVDADGNPTVFSWEATEHVSTSLSPLYARTFTLFVPTAEDTQGPITIAARLRFRPFPPFLIRLLGFEDFVEKLVITDIDEATVTVDVE